MKTEKKKRGQCKHGNKNNCFTGFAHKHGDSMLPTDCPSLEEECSIWRPPTALLLSLISLQHFFFFAAPRRTGGGQSCD